MSVWYQTCLSLSGSVVLGLTVGLAQTAVHIGIIVGHGLILLG